MGQEEQIAINGRCIRFYLVCDEIMDRYRDTIYGKHREPMTTRDRLMEKAMKTIASIIELDEAYMEE